MFYQCANLLPISRRLRCSLVIWRIASRLHHATETAHATLSTDRASERGLKWTVSHHPTWEVRKDTAAWGAEGALSERWECSLYFGNGNCSIGSNVAWLLVLFFFSYLSAASSTLGDSIDLKISFGCCTKTEFDGGGGGDSERGGHTHPTLTRVTQWDGWGRTAQKKGKPRRCLAHYRQIEACKNSSTTTEGGVTRGRKRGKVFVGGKGWGRFRK